MSELLANRVPVEPIARVVREYLDAQDDLSVLPPGSYDAHYSAPEVFPGPKRVLAEKVLISADTLDSIVREDVTTVDFNVADRLLCVTGNVDLWLTELHEVYYSTPLDDEDNRYPTKSTKRFCERPGCGKMFEQHPRQRSRHRYCSKACRAAEQRKRRRARRGQPVGQRFGTKYGQCPNGHDRSPENVGYKSNGSMYCTACGREKARKWYEANREKKKAAERARRAARKGNL